MKDILERAARIRLLILDVDGVLTDGSLFIGDDGQEYKAFNSRDGHGIKMLKEYGVEIAIITGRTSEVVRIRMASLGIQHVYQGKREKLPAYLELKAETGLEDGQIAYVGDDVTDIEVMQQDFYSRDDPAYRDGVIKPQLDAALKKREQIEEQLREAEPKLDKIKEDARKDGGQPGWFRGLEPPPPPGPTPTPDIVID